jgi:hypothetical protein
MVSWFDSFSCSPAQSSPVRQRTGRFPHAPAISARPAGTTVPADSKHARFPAIRWSGSFCFFACNRPMNQLVLRKIREDSATAEHPTSNSQRALLRTLFVVRRWMLDVGCWMFGVGCFQRFMEIHYDFDAVLWGHEPSERAPAFWSAAGIPTRSRGRATHELGIAAAVGERSKAPSPLRSAGPPSIDRYIAVVFFSQALWRFCSFLKSISTLSASVAVNRQSSGNTWPQAPHNLWRRL